MADRVLFIGVGGSGGATLHYLYADLERRLRDLGWNEGVPDAWQFLHIDATTNPDEGDRYVPPVLRDSRHYLPLTAKETKYEDYTRDLISKPEVAGGWLPATAPQRIWLGAGQRRAIGRVLALESMDRIYERIRDLIDLTERPDSRNQLAMLDRQALGGTGSGEGDLEVFVIASLGGGSGSGMHQDISLLLRAAFKEADRHISVLYPPDIFDAIESDFRRGVAPNSLAGIAELMAAHFAEGELTASENDALSGVTSRNFSTGSRAPYLAFFQGRSNGEITMDTPSDVYQATARTLSAILLNKANREQMKSYVQGNPSPVPSRREFLADQHLADGVPDWQVGMSFGYTNLSLGMSNFKEYGAQRLAKLVLGRVLDDTESVARLRREQTAEFVRDARQFAIEAGLDETTSDPKGTLSTISGAWVDSAPLIDTLRAKLAGLGDDARARRAAQQESDNALDQRKPDFIVALESRVDRATDQLVATTLKSIARTSVDATVQYLAQLQEDLTAAASRWASGGGAREGQSLLRPRAGTQPPAKSTSVINKLTGAIRGDKALTAGAGAPIASALGDVFAPFRSAFEGYQRAAIAYALAGFAVNVVLPIREALEGGQRELASRLQVDIPLRTRMDDWPGETAPSPIRAAQNELFLIEDSTFKEEFERLLAMSLSATSNTGATGAAATSYEGALPIAITEVLGGSGVAQSGARIGERIAFWPSNTMGDSVDGCNTRLAVVDRWDPGLTPDFAPSLATVGSTDRRRCVKVSFSVDPVQVLDDAREWMATRKGITKLTTMTIADYLSESGAEGLKRRTEFVAKFATAVGMARPMAEVDESAVRAYHGVDDSIGLTTAVSVVPLAPGTDEANEVLSILTRENASLGGVDFAGDAEVQEVHITRYLAKQVNPFVLANVMQPAVAAWEGQLRKSANDPDFWACRRAHRLPAFVPVAPSVLVRMVKGWNLARSLQVIADGEVDQFLEGRGRLTFTADGVERSFPGRLVTPVDSEHPQALLPALLEAFPFALLDVAAGRTDAIEAYASLASIGAASRTLISTYLQSGVVLGHTPSGLGDTTEERLRVLHDEVQGRRNDLAEVTVPAGARTDDRTAYTPTWELREVSLKALDSLLGEITAPTAARRLKA